MTMVGTTTHGTTIFGKTLARMRRLWIRRKVMVIAVVLLVGSGVVFGAARYSNRSPEVPTLDVKRGKFIDSIQFRGEVKAMKSVTISAPAEAGDLQIIKIATDGTQVKQDDVVVEFDKTKTEQDLAQRRSTMKSAQAEIDQAKAQARLTEEEDVTAVKKARFDVETAKLDASKQEIVSKIEGAEANLKTADAEQKLHEVEEKLTADRAVNKATIESKVEASKKADYDVKRAESALTKMKLLAPAAGMISLISTWRPGGEGPFKPGDRAWPGAPMAELPDVSTLRVSARADETERGRLALNETVSAQLDAIPDRQFTGKIEQISTIATIDFSGGLANSEEFQSGDRAGSGRCAPEARDDGAAHRGGGPGSGCAHDSGGSFISEIGADRGLRVARVEIPGASNRGGTTKPRPHPGGEGFERRRPRGFERSYGEGVIPRR